MTDAKTVATTAGAVITRALKLLQQQQLKQQQ
jgi:hypothetical protein